jgi:anionic cell wall polymer biosynthesis LytR-Cps2A-Psr (LCP) family protein
MRNKVSELLYGMPVDSSIALVMDGIPDVADALGGVTVTLEEDATELDPSYQEGATVTLSGEEIETFLRYRDTDETGSNDLRMNRQEVFLRGILVALQGGSTKVSALIDAGGDNLYTDMTLDEMIALSEATDSLNFVKLAGQTTEGELHDEYYPDQDALVEQIINLFYQVVE